MSHNLPTLLFVDAMVGATAYAHPHPEVSDLPLSAQAMAHVRRARVDIYCSHNDQAISAIREARRELQAISNVAVAGALTALDEASWMTRHNDFLRAEEALENALALMRAMSAQTFDGRLKLE